MNVFADYHHGSLFYSLHLLFEKRMGASLFRPIGMEWVEKEIWRYYDHPDTQRQFLGLEQGSLEPKSRLNENRRLEDGIYYVEEPAEHFEQKAVTFEKFIEMDWDVILASVPVHLLTFSLLRSTYKPKAKLIYQMGNEFFPVDFGLAKNILASTAPFAVPSDVNAVFYHQEFDLDVFRYEVPTGRKKIKSYLNWQGKTSDAPIWEQYKEALPEFEFYLHGVNGDDGVLTGTDLIAKSMADATFVWHCKPGGDGFGHIVHNVLACGRPVIGRFSHYKGKLAESILQDEVTGIDFDKREPDENVRLIRHYAEPLENVRMCARAHKRFKEVVDYDLEYKEIQRFMENLV